MDNDKIFFQVMWVSNTNYWLKKAELESLSVEIIKDLLHEEKEDLSNYNSVKGCVIIENIVTYFGNQSIYVEYSWEVGTSIINVTDFEFFEPNNISDAILDKLNDMRKLAL
jgi:capsule polysaccharide export protein KpsE/RkpR